MDANQDVYKGHLALRLQKGPFNMTCMMEDAMGGKFLTHTLAAHAAYQLRLWYSRNSHGECNVLSTLVRDW